jgi:5'-3' exonuclease
MGIPRFYRLITEQFPAVSKQISFKRGFPQDVKIDNLYLDANGIIHNCAYEVYFNKKPRLSKGKVATVAKEVILFKAIASYIDQLLKFAKPQKVFYIAIDGPAPLAKQTQQRQRRYKSADEKTDEQRKMFDSTAITPGTEFMYRLDRYLQFYVRRQLSIDPNWRGLEVVISGANIPGEGEHKIVQYIRDLEGSEELTHCMYGLDADLFMLSLGTHCPKFYLLREDQFKTVWNDTLFYIVDIGALRGALFGYWGSLGGTEKHLIDDFIFCCFLVGNDFLHSLPGCGDLQSSINLIMDLRRDTLGSSYLTNGLKFNLNNLTILLKEFAKTEAALISKKFYNQNFPNITLNSSLIDPQRPDKGIDLEKYRRLYYLKAGIDAAARPNTVADLCIQYIQGLEWVQYYYHARPKNWRWQYTSHYSPLVTDIVAFLTGELTASPNTRLTRVSTVETAPILPFQQLLCVVPPKSRNLLPKYLQSLYTCGDLVDLYPDSYAIDLEGKNREWEAIALLPFVDLERVIAAYNDAKKMATSKKQQVIFHRNTHGSPTTLVYDSSIGVYEYKSVYGKITNCKISARQ